MLPPFSILSMVVIAFSLQISLPYDYIWIGFLFREGANLVFFVVTGIQFRPASNNPYLQLPQSDDEEEMEEVCVTTLRHVCQHLKCCLLCRLTQSGSLDGVTRVNVRDTSSLRVETTSLKQRECSHEYD